MSTVASLVFAAGRGTRMKGYFGNKTLLPLIPAKSRYQGARPLIREVLDNLPSGPKGIVVNYHAEQVRRVTEGQGISFVYQPVTNGTGEALLAARSFLNSADADRVIITMGDVPLIRSATYYRLLDLLGRFELTLLAFECKDRGQYGMIEMEGRKGNRDCGMEILEGFSFRKAEQAQVLQRRSLCRREDHPAQLPGPDGKQAARCQKAAERTVVYHQGVLPHGLS